MTDSEILEIAKVAKKFSYPWLDSDCMADETTDKTLYDDCDDEYIDEYEEDSYDSFLNTL